MLTNSPFKQIVAVLLFSSVLNFIAMPVVFASGDSLDKLSEKLIQLRGEVEVLNNEIHFVKQEHRQEMSFLWSQKNAVRTELERNNKLISRLKNDLAKKVQENQDKGLLSEQIKPEFMLSIERVEHYLAGSLPFKLLERQASLQEIKTQVQQNLISVQRGFNKLWAFLDDEIRLTKETGLFQQSIAIAGEPNKKLVDVARVGMMTLYFQTADNKVGLLTGKPDNWSFEFVSDNKQQQQIEYLFSSLQKQIRTGLFLLPFNLATQEE